jgi:mono/diheme cytochrome c family protein
MLLLPTRISLPIFILAIALAGPASAGDKTSSPVIPGFERFHAKGENPVAGGRLLLGELNCISCHRPEPALESHLIPKQAPILDGVGQRIQRTYLQKFLSDPQAVKPGTAMPNLFAGMPEQERTAKVEALIHFLGSSVPLPQEAFDRKGISLGRDLYNKIGCVACHGPRDNNSKQTKTWPGLIELGDLSTKYSLTSLRVFLENPLHTRPSARMPGLLDGKEAKLVANYLMQGLAWESVGPNLKYAYFQGSFDMVPKFSDLKPKASGQSYGFDLGLAKRNNDYAISFDGFLRIEKEGKYQFHLHSDDGSRLLIDDKLVVDNDGIHPPTTKSGSVKLTAGSHKLHVGFFQGGGGAELSLEFQGPGLDRQDIVPYLYLTAEGPAKVKPIAKAEPDFVIQPRLAEQGGELFTTMGCANCHQYKVLKKTLDSKLIAPALAKLSPDTGCMEASPTRKQGSVPHYALNPAQRTALVAALKAPVPAPLTPNEAGIKESVARTFTTFNCYACHVRDKIGGVEELASPYFHTSDADLADEGRLPPTLTGVGAKLKPAYFKQVLDKGAHDRPYMQTRMPRFGDANVGHLVTLLPKIDKIAVVPEVAFNEPITSFKSEGRHMVGKDAFGCIQCHTFAGKKALGIQGIDMTIMTARVNRDWFHQYLRDPASFRPLTRMPTAWPGGMSTLPKILEGDPAKQIEAIWVYLADGSKAQPPKGVNETKNPIALVPDKEAIIYRNFLEGAGPRAIGVGYPEKAHLAFDANDLRLALLWKGAFLNAGRHWNGRGEGFEPPLGDNILHLPNGVSFAVLAKENDPWPTKSARDLGTYKFLGYRLGEDERPTFMYSIGDVKVEEFANPLVSKTGVSMTRTLNLVGDKTANLYFRAMTADKIESLKDGWYRIGGTNGWKMRIESTAAPQIRAGGEGMELLVPVAFKEGKARIVQEFVW